MNAIPSRGPAGRRPSIVRLAALTLCLPASVAPAATDVITGRLDPGGPARFELRFDPAADDRTTWRVNLDGRAWTEPRPARHRLLLRDDRFDPVEGSSSLAPLPLAADDAAAAATDGPELWIVQCHVPVIAPVRAGLEAAGLRLVRPLPEHAVIVEAGAGALEAAGRLDVVRWTGRYRPTWRLASDLRDAAIGALAAEAEGRSMAGREPIRVNVVLADESPAGRRRVGDRIVALGGTVDRLRAGATLVEATLAPADVGRLANDPGVLWIDRWTPLENDMDIARAFSGANDLETVAGFTGEGVRAEVMDDGFNLGHVDFQGPPLLVRTPGDERFHGSATSGILFGQGVGNPAARGMLPGAQGIVSDYQLIAEGQSRYEHTIELVRAPWNAVLQSASFGSGRTTEYTSISAEIDRMLFDLDLVLVQSQSNASSRQSRPQAWAKNVVSVGGIRHFNTESRADDCWGCGSSGASIGPAADGRIKPDLAHFYDLTQTTASGADDAYTPSFGGTSGATPITAGHFGLMFQMWSEGVFPVLVRPGATVFENRPRMVTAKAMMINAAEPYDFEGDEHDLTRVHQGWGMASVRRLWEHRDRIHVVDGTDLLTAFETTVHELVVPAGETELRVTMCYADPAAVPGAAIHRINDLSLRVISPSGIVYHGNHGLREGNVSIPGGSPDAIDTVENVWIAEPEAGPWTIEISADELIEDAHLETDRLDAAYALVVSGVEPVVAPIGLRLAGPLPSLVEPGTMRPIEVVVLEGAEALEPGSGIVRLRRGPGEPVETVPLTPLGDGRLEALLPPLACGDEPTISFEVVGDGGSVAVLPPDAPEAAFALEVGTTTVVFADDFEEPGGWTVEDDGSLTAGSWERGEPVGNGVRGDPAAALGGSGACMLTGNAPGDSDVDGGPTRLLSPPIELSGASAATGPTFLTCWTWLDNDDGPAPGEDPLTIELSQDAGVSWTTVLTVGPLGTGGWTEQSTELDGLVDLEGPPIRLRVSIADGGAPSIVEAAIDAVRITQTTCACGCPADVDGDGLVGTDELLLLLGAWGSGDDALDLAPPGGDGVIDTADLLALLAAWGPCP